MNNNHNHERKTINNSIHRDIWYPIINWYIILLFYFFQQIIPIDFFGIRPNIKTLDERCFLSSHTK